MYKLYINTNTNAAKDTRRGREGKRKLDVSVCVLAVWFFRMEGLNLYILYTYIHTVNCKRFHGLETPARVPWQVGSSSRRFSQRIICSGSFSSWVADNCEMRFLYGVTRRARFCGQPLLTFTARSWVAQVAHSQADWPIGGPWPDQHFDRGFLRDPKRWGKNLDSDNQAI